jgi:hypothetical protein
MREDQNQCPDDSVEVRRDVYDTGKRLEALEGLHGLTGWHYAALIRDAYRSYGEPHTESAAFWHDVYRYLMELECTAAGAPTIILEEDGRRTQAGHTP